MKHHPILALLWHTAQKLTSSYAFEGHGGDSCGAEKTREAGKETKQGQIFQGATMTKQQVSKWLWPRSIN